MSGTLSDIERLAVLADADQTFQMDEEAFRAFYDEIARPVWGYLARMTGSARAADDLLQEAYYRFLKVRVAFDDEAHRRNYLYRIATNLAHDHRPRPQHAPAAAAEVGNVDANVADRTVRRIDLTRAMARLKPRERSLLWLAYAQGWSHEEIGRALGVKTGSLKVLLFRARRRLIGLMTGERA